MVWNYGWKYSYVLPWLASIIGPFFLDIPNAGPPREGKLAETVMCAEYCASSSSSLSLLRFLLFVVAIYDMGAPK